jgi:hypothetical protein
VGPKSTAVSKGVQVPSLLPTVNKGRQLGAPPPIFQVTIAREIIATPKIAEYGKRLEAYKARKPWRE